MIKKLIAPVTQVLYADDAAAYGKISDLRAWWDRASFLGPSFGYFPKSGWYTKMFSDTAVNVTADGRPHLGAPVLALY